MKNKIVIASRSRFFPKVGCYVFFTLKSIDQKEIFTGLSSLFPKIYFFLSLWECYLENENSLGNGRGKTISIFLLTVHHLLLYRRSFLTISALPQPHFSFCILMSLKLEDIWPGAVLPVLIQAPWLCAVFGMVLSHWVGVPILSVCLPLPSPDLCQC